MEIYKSADLIILLFFFGNGFLVQSMVVGQFVLLHKLLVSIQINRFCTYMASQREIESIKKDCLEVKITIKKKLAIYACSQLQGLKTGGRKVGLIQWSKIINLDFLYSKYYVLWFMIEDSSILFIFIFLWGWIHDSLIECNFGVLHFSTASSKCCMIRGFG